MKNCLTCNSNCFPEPLSCYFHSTKGIGVVKTGDNQELINEKLAQEIEDIKSKLGRSTSCTSSNCTCGQQNVSTSTPTQVTTSSKSLAKVSTTSSATSVKLEYDVKEAAESLGTVLSSNVKVRSNNGATRIVKDTDQLISAVSLRPDDFPAVMDVDVRVLTETGEKALKQSITLKPEGGSDQFFLKSTEMIDTPQNQSDQNKVFEARIKNVEDKTSGVDVSELLRKISSLESDLQRLNTQIENK